MSRCLIGNWIQRIYINMVKEKEIKNQFQVDIFLMFLLDDDDDISMYL